MSSLYTALAGKFSVYTMDHRGTGRSNVLDCTASQATAAGSPGGSSVTLDELPSCILDLEFEYSKQFTVAFYIAITLC